MLKKRGLINPKETKRRVKAARSVRLRATRELKVADFGDLVQFDSKHFNLPWGDKRFQITAIDVLGKRKISRTYSHLSSRKPGISSCLCKKSSHSKLKEPRATMDRSLQVSLTIFCKSLAFHIILSTRTVQSRTRVLKRAIQTDLKEFYQNCNFADTIEEQNRLLEEWDETYNSYRPHQAIGYLTPDEFYQKRQSAIIKPLRVAYLLDLSAVYHVMNQNNIC